jgi:hypothetical protein
MPWNVVRSNKKRKEIEKMIDLEVIYFYLLGEINNSFAIGQMSNEQFQRKVQELKMIKERIGDIKKSGLEGVGSIGDALKNIITIESQIEIVQNSLKCEKDILAEEIEKASKNIQ